MFAREHFAAVELALVVPFERLGQPFLHADVEFEHDEDCGLEEVRQIEGLRAKLERFRRIAREEHRMLGVAVRRVGREQQI